MNFYRYRKYFAHNVYSYFGLSEITLNLYKKAKSRIYIIGRCNKILIFMYLWISFFVGIVRAVDKYDKSINLDKLGISFLVFLAVTIILIIKSYYIHHKLIPKATNINIYERELPSNLRPAHVRLLMNDGLVDEYTLASTLLDLVDRDYLKLEYNKSTDTNLKENLFKDKDIIITRTNKPIDNLFEYEKYLIEWFLGYNDGETITGEQLHQSLIKDIDNDNLYPCDRMNFFSALVLTSFPLEKYYTKINRKKRSIIYVIFMLLGFIPNSSYLCEFLSLYGFGTIFLVNPLYVFNQDGVNLRKSYENLKKYLEDFSQIKNKDLQNIELWGFYLTYSIALEVDSKAFNELVSFFGDEIFKLTYSDEEIAFSKEDTEELQYSIKEWNNIFAKERLKELKKYDGLL